MTEQEYTERNELISEFMGLKEVNGYHSHPSPARGFCRPGFLEYHHNRNWLHSAWERFRDLRFEKVADQFEHSNFKTNIAYCICYRDVESTFQSIVSGIQWYNSIK